MKKLGKNQLGVLQGLYRHKRFFDTGYGCGWHWGSGAITLKICDTLVKQGMAECNEQVYTITESGKEYLSEHGYY